MRVLKPLCQTGCGNPSPGGYICRDCTRDVEKAIVTVAAMLPELDVTATRQDRLEGSGPAIAAADPRRVWSPSDDDPEGSTTLVATNWAMNWDAADLLYSARNTISTWIRHLCESRGITPEFPAEMLGPIHAWCGHRSCEAIRLSGTQDQKFTAWLLRNVESIRQDEVAAQIVDEFANLARAAERAVDRRDPDVYAGRCDSIGIHFEDDEEPVEVEGCDADMYARFGATTVKCESCGSNYELKARKDHMLNQLDDVLARPVVIANGLTSLEEPVTASRIDVWATRKLIYSPSKDREGKALYRVGDVRGLLANEVARRARKRLAA